MLCSNLVIYEENNIGLLFLDLTTIKAPIKHIAHIKILSLLLFLQFFFYYNFFIRHTFYPLLKFVPGNKAIIFNDSLKTHVIYKSQCTSKLVFYSCSQTCIKQYNVAKPVHCVTPIKLLAVTCIKRSPYSCSFIENFI